MGERSIYNDIAERTGGDIYIGVVGPVRLAYEQLIPTVEYFAYKLGVVMTQAMRDLEE